MLARPMAADPKFQTAADVADLIIAKQRNRRLARCGWRSSATSPALPAMRRDVPVRRRVHARYSSGRETRLHDGRTALDLLAVR